MVYCACDNNYAIHFIHDTVRNNNDLVFPDDDDHNAVIVDHCASDCDYDRDCYNDHNNNINVITCDYDYDNYDEDNNTHVDRYDVGIVRDNNLVANNRAENNYATSLVPSALSSSGATSIIDDYGPVGANDHYMIRCYNTSSTISGTSSLTSLTILLNLSNLETSSSSYRDTCVGCNSHNGDDTDLDLDLVPVHFNPITTTHLSPIPSSLEPMSLSSNFFHLSSDCDLVSLRYITVDVVASLTTTFFSQVSCQALCLALLLF